MTDLHCPPFTLTTEPGPGTVRLRLVGDLDYDTSEQLVERAHDCLAAEPGLRDLFLDCAQLRLCDSMGVSSLLLIHRGTSSRGVGLHLENPPDFLRRILDVTGILPLFVPGPSVGETGGAHAQDGPPPARHETVPPPAPSG
ncbi:STAS domain-containing protein [Streptomyces clavifer]|uniref:STAS domain-containing protein n=1 Tax=Streptomyces clavifer TaxID=68188 RepID=UPI0037B56C10